MDKEQKKRILKRFLKEISTDARIEITDKMLLEYQELDKTLDFLEKNAVGILDFSSLEEEADKWDLFRDIIQTGIQFSSGTPPSIIQLNIKDIGLRINFWRRDQHILNYPQNDFYNRTVRPGISLELTELIKLSQIKLGTIIKSALYLSDDFDVANTDNLNLLASSLKKELKKEQKTGQHSDKHSQSELIPKITLVDDLKKINELSVMHIPNDIDGNSVKYCSLAESAGGVTEKISLIQLSHVIERLENLRNSEIESANDYMSNRNAYKLSTEAILKLPKHGEIREVQRESMALNISRLLGLDTACSSMMTYNDEPALFVPFEDIKLLHEFAHGKTMKAFGLSGQTYEHYSTIDPVGSGLMPNVFIDDFGKALGLIYLCSDTDSIGGYNQNKALRNDRTLYIFDQVIMAADKLTLDSRLSLEPSELLMKHTRHGQGRNRTLIEDSSISSKFDSLIALKQQQKILLQYADKTLHMHQQEMNHLTTKLVQGLPPAEHKKYENKFKQIELLRNDAELIKKVIAHRIKKIDEAMPNCNHKINNNDIKQTLILERLINNPVLFTPDGRPYRHPWKQRHTNTAKRIEEYDSNNIIIHFDSKISKEMKACIEKHGDLKLNVVSKNKVLISRLDLQKLNETLLYPECAHQLLHQKDYLNPQDLMLISDAYGKGHRDRIISVINNYKLQLTQSSATVETTFAAINATQTDIKNLINTAKDQGFGKHIFKKLQFDIQQQLQKMMPPLQKPQQIDLAFSAALQLDRVEEFNQVVQHAILTNQLTNPIFIGFLDDCIRNANITLNHYDAIAQSQMIAALSKQTITCLTQKPLVTKSQMSGLHKQNTDELDNIDPLSIIKNELHQQQIFTKTAANLTIPPNKKAVSTPSGEIKPSENRISNQ